LEVQKRLLSRGDQLGLDEVQRIVLASEMALSDSENLHKSGNYLNKVSTTRQTKSVDDSNLNIKHRNRGNVPKKGISCYRCLGNHYANECKFKDTKCHLCKLIGHIKKACKSKINDRLGTKHVDGSLNSLYCLGIKNSIPPYKVKLLLDNNFVNMEIDSGSGFSILNERIFEKFWNQDMLSKDNIKIKLWTNQQLKIMGSLLVDVVYGNHTARLPLLIVKGDGPCLLGRGWFSALGIEVSRCNVLQSMNRVDFLLRFSELFGEDLGVCEKFTVHIEIDKDARPVFKKARPVVFALRDKVEQAIDLLVKQNVWEPVEHSKWASPLVVVMKKDGQVRLCGDYKSTVNQVSSVVSYPLPTVNELLSKLTGGKIFTKLDMAQAYHQLRLDDESAEILTLNTIKGLFRVKRLPFGISSAVGIFQKFMETVLAGISGVAVYLDDILIVGNTVEEHNTRVSTVLKKLKELGLRLRKDKCYFYENKIEFLGYELSPEGINPTREKVIAIQRARVPLNKTELQAFLGLLNFYERFLKGKAESLEPLHRLLDKNAFWRWESRHERAFNKAREMLSSDSLLVHFDNSLPVVLSCDASSYGVGCVLSHLINGEERPIAFGSRTLSKTERNYAVIDKEALAVVFGIKKFHQYLFGRDFKIFTDHKPLLGLFDSRRVIPISISPRMLRWSIILSAYSYTLCYREGNKQGNADAMSRLPLPETVPEDDVRVTDVLFLEDQRESLCTAKVVAKITKKDKVLSRLLNFVQKGWPDRCPDDSFKAYFGKSREISAHRDCLLWGNRVIVPDGLRKEILDKMHDLHLGIVHTKALARSYVWWPQLDKEIERMIKSCQICQASRNNPKKSFYPWIWPSRPWSRLHIDHLGPFQGKLILIVVDAYSKWVEAKIVSSTSAFCTMAVLRGLFATHGIPDIVVSDNATSFVSKDFKTFLERNGIRHILSSPYHAATNGQAERMVQTVKQAIRRSQVSDWNTKLARILLTLHTTPSSTTGNTPSELLMGRKIKTLMDRLHPDLESDVLEKQEVGWRASRKSNVRCPIDMGSNVQLREYGNRKWSPGKVVGVKGPLSYEVERTNGDIVRRHLDQLRPVDIPDVDIPDDDIPADVDIADDDILDDVVEDQAIEEKVKKKVEPVPPVLRRSERLKKLKPV
jgi:hypothetical protein